MNKAIRKIDAHKYKGEYAKSKLKGNCSIHDIKARNAFAKSKVTIAMIKCTYGVNLCGMRISVINKNECGYLDTVKIRHGNMLSNAMK